MHPPPGTGGCPPTTSDGGVPQGLKVQSQSWDDKYQTDIYYKQMPFYQPHSTLAHWGETLLQAICADHALTPADIGITWLVYGGGVRVNTGGALTLGLGVLVSMFTALTCSRTFLLFVLTIPSLRRVEFYTPKSALAKG